MKNTFESGPEKIFTKEEVLSIISKYAEKLTRTLIYNSVDAVEYNDGVGILKFDIEKEKHPAVSYGVCKSYKD